MKLSWRASPWVLLTVLSATVGSAQAPVGTAFTYQGRLRTAFQPTAPTTCGSRSTTRPRPGTWWVGRDRWRRRGRPGPVHGRPWTSAPRLSTARPAASRDRGAADGRRGLHDPDPAPGSCSPSPYSGLQQLHRPGQPDEPERQQPGVGDRAGRAARGSLPAGPDPLQRVERDERERSPATASPSRT